MDDTSNLKYTLHKYGDHELQRIGVWTWARPTGAQHSVPGDPYASTSKYWFVYIHGGIWRDPRTTHLQALPAFSILAGNTGNQARIAGFASIDYRLSPHPDFPQDEGTTPANELRNAKHPDHLSDVRSALALLRREYGVGNRGVGGETPYVLYGHSCGATLALQVIMGEEFEVGPGKEAVPAPAGVVGLQGMYDLVGLNARFGGAYRDMIAGAFGDDEEVWKRVSPARFEGKFSQAWEGSERGVVVLAHSPEDEWVDMAELDAMEARLKGEKSQGQAPLHVQAKRDLKGGHDEVAENGGTVAGVLIETVGLLDMVAKLTKTTEEMLGLT